MKEVMKFCKCGEFLGETPKHELCKVCLEADKKKKDKESRAFLRDFKGRMK